MEKRAIEERIRLIAHNTDGLITKLDTLTNRIDTAKVNENQELVEHYERQFAEASVEFMGGVEAMLDDWYALRGVERPPAEEEELSPELLDEIHNTVVAIIQGLSAVRPVDSAAIEAGMGKVSEDIARRSDAVIASPERPVEIPTAHQSKKGGKRSRVDITG